MLEPLFIKVIEVTRRFVFLQLIFGALGVRLVFHVVAIEEFVIEQIIVLRLGEGRLGRACWLLKCLAGLYRPIEVPGQWGLLMHR